MPGSFYLFGMGSRRKLLYRRGELLDALTGERLRAWEVADEHVDSGEHCVVARLADESVVRLSEDEQAAWLEEGGDRQCLSAGPVQLPRFGGHPHAPLLRALHQELLVNLVGGAPTPNLLVYPRPWLRDAALVAMCLERTNNLALIEPWVGGLRDPFDRNNGVEEPDNLGQALYLASLVSEASHPLVEAVLRRVGEFGRGRHILGPTDGAEHPVYQTKWLKLGLRALGLEDPYVVPDAFDSYSALFWMDFREAHVPGPSFSTEAGERYPYLTWAEAHFHDAAPPLHLGSATYPHTWEAHASQADYAQMGRIDPEYVAQRRAAPHTWHAAEMFLYLLERG
ncbi:MAG: hypothetical protein FJX74_26165 [Armatimonadetes bacterium]|nr:hypothetical protein [Armatimonadota bacterium]